MDNTKKILFGMIDDLSKRGGKKKKELIEEYINARLDKSLKSYYEELMQTYKSLTKRDAARVLKRVMSSGDSNNDKIFRS